MRFACLSTLLRTDKVTDDKRFGTGDSRGDSCHQGLEDVPLGMYKKVKKLLMTNEKFRGGSWRASSSPGSASDSGVG
jgi:hypothetical protein